MEKRSAVPPGSERLADPFVDGRTYLRISDFVRLDRSTIRVCSELQELLQLGEVASFDSSNEPGALLRYADMVTATKSSEH